MGNKASAVPPPAVTALLSGSPACFYNPVLCFCCVCVTVNVTKRLLRVGVPGGGTVDAMPRKKKSAQSSPSRVPGRSADVTNNNSSGGSGQSTSLGLRGYESAMASDLSSMARPDKEEIVKNMKEMFSHLDPEVIYIVLSECGFKG